MILKIAKLIGRFGCCIQFLTSLRKKCKEKFDVAGVIVDAVNKICEDVLHI